MLTILQVAIFLIAFASAYLIAYQVVPSLTDKFHSAQSKKVSIAEKQLDGMFVIVKREKLFFYYTLTPLIFGAVGFILFRKIPIAIAAGAAGSVPGRHPAHERGQVLPGAGGGGAAVCRTERGRGRSAAGRS